METAITLPLEQEQFRLLIPDDRDWLIFDTPGKYDLEIKTNQYIFVVQHLGDDYRGTAFYNDVLLSFEVGTVPMYIELATNFMFSSYSVIYRVNTDFVEDSYEDDDDIASATLLTEGTPQDHSLISNEFDYFSVNLTSPVIFILDILVSTFSVNLECKGFIFDENSQIIYNMNLFSANNQFTFELLPGLYYIRLHRNFGTLNYTISSSSSELILEANEPNNDFETATPVDLNSTMTGGQLRPIFDVDYFSFDLPVRSEVIIDPTITHSGNYIVNAKIFDQNNIQVHHTQYSSGAGEPNIVALLNAGSYYIQFSCQGWSQIVDSFEFSLTAHYLEPFYVDDYEMNNVISNATYLALNSTTSDLSLSSVSDIDYFSFDIINSTVVNAMLNVNEELGNNVVLELFNDTSLIDQVTYSNTDISGKIIQYLGPGLYYLKIYSPSQSTEFEFTLSLTNYDLQPDLIPPTITNPDDEIFDGIEAPAPIIWHVEDENPANYSLYVNGSAILVHEIWEGESISFDYSTLSIGLYNITIVVFDTAGNFVTDTVFVTILETPEFEVPSIDLFGTFEYYTNQEIDQIYVNLYDEHPNDLTIYLDGDIIIYLETWSSGEYQFSVPTQSVGEYNWTIVVTDSFGNLNVKTLFLSILELDITHPYVSSPADVEYEVGSTNNYIVWTLGDQNPGNFTVKVDEIDYIEGSWTNGTVTVNIDNLSIGSHEVTISVSDDIGNVITDTVVVNVVIEDSGTSQLSGTTSTSTNSDPDVSTDTTKNESSDAPVIGLNVNSNAIVFSLIVGTFLLKIQRKRIKIS